MARHLQTGRLGEQLASEWLLKNGFTILHQNWRYSHFEVDFIASKAEVLHFIEIKTRRTRKYGFPEDDVSQKKIENLIHASEEYLVQNEIWKRIQFDILSISLLPNATAEYYFIEDVYLK